MVALHVDMLALIAHGPLSKCSGNTWDAIGKSDACEKSRQPCLIFVHINAKTLETRTWQDAKRSC